MSVGVLRQTLEDFRIGSHLAEDVAATFFNELIAERDENLLADILSAWNRKGIAEDEIFALASIMRSRMKRIASKHGIFIDAVGTGGSRAKTFNVSTAAGFVIAGADVPVAKHGNRAASSKTGSADVLSELGVQVDVEREIAEQCLNQHGICFMFAPKFHSLSPTLAAARRRLGEPTIFNCVGPLCNPADAPHQLIGAWDESIARSIANVLARLGTKKSWVVHGADGMDEISPSGPTTVFEVCCDSVRKIDVSPEDFGIATVSSDAVPKANTPSESAAIVSKILTNASADTPAEKLAAMNAAAAIYLSGTTNSLDEAFDVAITNIRNGNASEKLNLLRAATNR
jgi:anthranilate phosphoribosyltransferase